MDIRIGNGYDVHALAPGLPMWLGVCIGRLSSFIAAALRLTHVPFDPSYYALKTVSSNLDFADASFPDTPSSIPCM